MAIRARRRFLVTIKEIINGAEKLNLPAEAIKDALEVTERIIEKRLVKKCAPKIIAAVSLYLTSKKYGIPITARDIVKNLDLCKPERTRFIRIARALARELKVGVPLEEYVVKIAKDLNLPEDVAEDARELVRKASELGLTAGRSPLGFAAAAIYMASRRNGIRISQREVASAAHVTEVTLRVRYKELKEKLGFEKAALEKAPLSR